MRYNITSNNHEEREDSKFESMVEVAMSDANTKTNKAKGKLIGRERKIETK